MTAVIGGVIFVGAIGVVLFIRHKRSSNPTRKSSGGSAPRRDVN